MTWRCVVGALVAATACAAPDHALADSHPALVMANPRGIPPIVNGFDATGAVIEGDWGLARPGAGTVTIYRGALEFVEPPEPPGFFPATGRQPHYGRHEIIPPRNRRLPRPAESYHRSWSSDPAGPVVPATVPAEPPPVIFAVPPERLKRRGRPSQP
ncbi:MAG: hypothetical protein IT538_14885 [Variibacter sp.]|nr:hypothetical protein [Variibacter sp.]